MQVRHPILTGDYSTKWRHDVGSQASGIYAPSNMPRNSLSTADVEKAVK